MKKFAWLLLAALLSLSAMTLMACNQEDAANDDSAATTVADGSAAAEGEATEAPAAETEPVETAAPKRDQYDFIDMYDDDGANHTPVSLMAEGSSVAARVMVAEGYLTGASITCPSWSNNVGNLTVRVYAWNTDYETTVAGAVLFEEEFVDYADNAVLTSDFATADSKGLAAGEYLWWLGNGVDETGSGVGLYAKQYPSDEKIVELYQNGAVIDNLGWEGSFDVVIPAE